MKIRRLIAQAVLWLFVFSSSIQMGGAAYEMLVVNPLWFGSPPESVTNWNPVPQFAIEPGRFWAVAVPFYMLSTLAILITAWFLSRPRRNWALIAGGVHTCRDSFYRFIFRSHSKGNDNGSWCGPQ